MTSFLDKAQRILWRDTALPNYSPCKDQNEGKGPILRGTSSQMCSVITYILTAHVRSCFFFLNQWSHKSSISRTEVEFFPTLHSQMKMTIRDQSGLHKAPFIPLTQQWVSWKQHYEAMLGFWGCWGALRKYILLPRVLVLFSKKHNGVLEDRTFLSGLCLYREVIPTESKIIFKLVLTA